MAPVEDWGVQKMGYSSVRIRLREVVRVVLNGAQMVGDEMRRQDIREAVREKAREQLKHIRKSMAFRRNLAVVYLIRKAETS